MTNEVAYLCACEPHANTLIRGVSRPITLATPQLAYSCWLYCLRASRNTIFEFVITICEIIDVFNNRIDKNSQIFRVLARYRAIIRMSRQISESL